ncbi:histidine kinase sensor domain-containing protein [Pseudoalteromonas spongiae]|uniref:histidine kinase sensor domain-containing protein n=1 Tax=Pseudoalteromonas spongiae TaxID=298657 RepID=UPI000C2D2921|nr:histidine kinase sensor domain-containing protein [Pseudoalteromonas spongiae]
MKRTLLWKLCFILATGLVSFFYFLHIVTIKTEEGMSFIAEQHRNQLNAWGRQAETLYLKEDKAALQAWLEALKRQEKTYVSIASFEALHIAGDTLDKNIVGAYHFGRSVEWKIHLYFDENPIMEVPFTQTNASLVIRLPDYMRPGSYWITTKFLLQVITPMALLLLLSIMLYRHIITPLQQLEKATSEFSRGNFSVRVGKYLGRRKDELADLAKTFDTMAARIGELIGNQRQLIADLSHELRTPLTRLDIAVANFEHLDASDHLARIERESKHIRKLVEDSLTLAWLDNEKLILQQESVDLVDLLDVLVDDARFEFPEHQLELITPNNAIVHNSNHRALAPAIENVIRNALRYTPSRGLVQILLTLNQSYYVLEITDQGPGIPEQYLEKIFEPFFRLDKARIANGDSFGLGLALAKRHLASVRARIYAKNKSEKGLKVVIIIPCE